MQQSILNRFPPLFTGIIIGAVFFSMLSYAVFTEPTSAPPGGNVESPINVGINQQTKSGNLWVNALGISGSGNVLLVSDPNGKVGIGTLNPTQALDVAGNVKGTGLCIGSDCRTSWPAGG